MKNSFLLLTILIVNVLSVIVITEDLHEEKLPDQVIPRLSDNSSLKNSRSGSLSPEVENENLQSIERSNQSDFKSKQPNFLIYEEGSDPSNLTARYELDEGSGNNINDTSGNDHNITGVADNFIPSAIGGYAYPLAGMPSPSAFEIPDHNDFSYTDGSIDISFTIDFWFNRTGSDQGSLICRSDIGANEKEYDLWISSGGAISIRLYDGDGDYIGRSTSNVIPLNNWSHVAIVYNANSTNEGIDIYLNGSISDTGDQSSGTFNGINNTAETTAIGGTDQGNFGWTTGVIDEVRFWDYNLTSSEISTLYDFAPNTTQVSELDISSTSISEDSDRLYAQNSTDFYYGVIENVTINSTNLMGYWQFNEGSGTDISDTSGLGHSGSYNIGSGSQYWSDSFNTAANYSIDFNASENQFISVSDHNDFSFGNGATDLPFSIEAWIYPHSVSGTRTIVGKYNSAGGNQEYYFSVETGGILAFRLFEAAGLGDHIYCTSSASSIVINQWTYVVGVYNGNGTEEGISVFINGVEDSDARGEIPTYSSMSNKNEDLKFGHFGTGGSGYYDGKIDEIRIWNRTLSSTEISVFNDVAPSIFAESFTINLNITYNGTGSVSHVNSSSFFDQTPSDYSSPYSLSFTINENDTQSGDLQIWVWAFDGVWRNETINVSITRDLTNGTTALYSLTETGGGLYGGGYIHISGQTVYFSNYMGSNDEFFEVAVNVSDGESGIQLVMFSEWHDDAQMNYSSAPFERIYSVDSSSTTGSIEIRTVDNVGNIEETLVITMDEDTTAPSNFQLVITNDTTPYHYDFFSYRYHDDSYIWLNGTGKANIVETESGLKFACYKWQVYFAGGWHDASSSLSVNHTLWNANVGNVSLRLLVYDNVGNYGISEDWLFNDNLLPTGYSLTWQDNLGILFGDYAYLTGTDLYFNDQISDSFAILVNDDGNMGQAEFWKIEWDKYSVFITGYNDTGGLPDAEYFSYLGNSSGLFVIRLISKSGHYQEWVFDAYNDSTAPIYDSFSLDVDSFANDPNYWHTLFPNTTLVNPSDSVSGLIPLFIEYSINDTWSSIPDTSDLTFTWNSTHGILDQYNHTLKFRLSDYVGNVNQSNSDWVICDTIAPILHVLSMDEMFAPNYYDQSIAHTANITVTWSETYPFKVDYGGVLVGYDDDAPSGGSSWINITITGESNGWYQVNIAIWDKAGWNDSTLTIPIYGYGIIQLDDSLGADEVEVWFYFYFFRSSGLGLDWKDFNVSYIVDEAWYSNNTESRIRGGLFAQKYLNYTSTIRFVVRDYFGNILLNNSYAMPTSRDLYLELAVNTLKVVNLYRDIVNMSIQRNEAIYTEQLMPNEIFSWNLYAAYYNISCILHRYGTYAFDDYDNLLLNYSVDLTAYDFSVFVRDLFTSLCYVIITDQSGNYLDARGFEIYVNEERIYSDTFLWNDTKATKNITITDVFGNLLHQDLTTDFISFLEIALNIWNVKVFNLDQDPIHLVITQNNLNVSEWIVQYTIEEFWLKEGTYTMYFYYTEINDDYAIENGTFVTKTAQITADYLIIVQSDDIIAIAVSVDVPQPADPNIEVEVVQNNTEVVAIVEGIKKEVDYVRGEISFIGSFISLSLLLVLIIILLALFLPQRYDELREKVREGKVKVYEKGADVKDEYFPEIDF